MESKGHKETLSRYLRGHQKAGGDSPSKNRGNSHGDGSPKEVRPKERWNSSTSGNADATMSSPANTNKMSQQKKVHIVRKMPNLGRKATIHDLPDEILLQVFGYLLPDELLIVARVCKHWLHLSNDNVIWHRIYSQYASGATKGMKDKESQGPVHSTNWKAQCVKRCAETRTLKSIITKKKINRFTGLLDGTEKSLQKAGTKWILSFVNNQGEEIATATNDDTCHFTMTASVRWYSLPTLNMPQVHKLRIYAANPIFFDKKGLALPNSPCQRSLLHERDFHWSSIKSRLKPVASDDSGTVDIYVLDDGLLTATWKMGRELAFIIASFHAHMLVERCIHGNSSQPYSLPPHVPTPDDIDRKHGLHSYACTLELRNHRTSLWKEQFLNLHCHDGGLGGGCAILQLIHPDRDYERSSLDKKLSMLWKTDALKGAVKNMCFLDITLLAESRKPMWCTSSAVNVQPADKSTVNYNYMGENQVLEFSDHRGKVFMLLIWEEDCQKYFITDLQVHLSLGFINQWFGTRH